MIKHIEQCSKCKVYVNGEPQRELSRKLLRSGASAGINKLLGWAIVSPIVGSIVPIVGTFFGFIITFFILLKIRSYSNTISNEIDKSMFEHTTYRFICPTCGNTWTKVLKTALSDIPDVILKEEKERKEISCKSLAKTNGIVALLAGLLTFSTFLYCCVADASIHTGITQSYFFGSFERVDTNWLWWLSAFVFIMSLFITLLEISVWKACRGEYKALQKMELKEFMKKYFK